MLETEFLKLKYHDNVESNTDEVDAEEYFNNNYKKIDANAKKQNEDLVKIKEDLEQENTELSSNMPWNTIQGKSLHITDSAKYSKNKLSISGDMEQEKRSGKNKFKLPESATSNGITYTNNGDGTFNLSGTATAQANFLIPVKNSFVEGKSYTVSSNKSIGAVRYYIHNCTSTGAWKKTQLDFTSETAKTKVFGESTTDYISCNIVVVTGATLNLTNVNVQVEEGTVATDWEQYGAMPSTEFPSMPVVATGVQNIRQFGKNVFDGEMELGNISATNGANENSSNRIRSKNYINVEGLTLIKLVNEIESIIKVIGVRYYDKNKNFIKSLTIYDTAKIPIYDNTKYIRFTVPDTTDLTLKYGINQDGSEEYEPYIEEINTLNLGTTELCKIVDANGNVVAKDRPVYRNGKWQWEKIIKKRVLNGTENWTDDTVSTVKHFRGKLDNLTYSKTNNAYCDKFICRTSEAHGEWEYIYIIGKACFINIDNTKLTEVSLNGFKTWLSNNNVTVYYVLATPEYIDCTAEQSAVLDKLYNNFTLQKGTNNIIVESENGVGVNLELDYMQDLQTKLNLLEAMCVSNASQEV